MYILLSYLTKRSYAYLFHFKGKGVYVFMVVQKQTKGWMKKSSSFPHTSVERIFFQSFARAKNDTKNAIETEQDIRRALNAKKCQHLK